jgi:hypothetical protein
MHIRVHCKPWLNIGLNKGLVTARTLITCLPLSRSSALRGRTADQSPVRIPEQISSTRPAHPDLPATPPLTNRPLCRVVPGAFALALEPQYVRSQLPGYAP